MNLFLTAVRLFLALTVLTGIVYPLAVTGIAKAAFPAQAEGSLIRRGGKVEGSALIGQAFDDPRYLWGRPSATSPSYNAAASSGSNQGPTNPALAEAIDSRVKALRDSGVTGEIPTDLVTASGSGLDPHISPEAAEIQLDRIANARSLSADRVREAIAGATEGRQLGFLGEPRVNVLRVNLALNSSSQGGAR